MIVSQHNFSSFDKIDLLEVVPPSSITDQDRVQFEEAKKKLETIKLLLDKAISVESVTEIPESYSGSLQQMKEEFLKTVNDLAVIHSVVGSSTKDLISRIARAIASINQLFNQWFELNSDPKSYIINSILSFDKSDISHTKTKYDSRLNELKKVIENVETLRKELEAKAAKSVVSNYAKIFSDEELKNKRDAIVWLVVSLVTSIALLIVLIFSFQYNWFHITDTIKTTEGEKVALNIPNLITKLFFISFSVFLISFFFKQYSICRNFQSLNNHRKNALNSYQLFVDSIGKDDPASRNALMLQVAKAIYEHANSGYLSGKQADSTSPNIIEFTKFVGENKNA